MLDENKAPAEADKAIDKSPASGEAGQDNKNPEAPYKLPEKFKGKSHEEIANAYVELEKKMGDQSITISEAKKLQEQTDTLLKAIWSDPDLYRQVEAGVKKYATGDTLPDKRTPNKGDEEAKEQEVDSVIKDVRVAQETQILNKFATDFGYNNLSQEERKAAYNRLTVSLAELVDPNGKKPVAQILKEIPLSRLPKFLENAHFMANKESMIQNARRSGSISNKENEMATIGGFPASNGKRESSVTLTNREREIAQKQGISEEKYLKRKEQIASENKRFE